MAAAAQDLSVATHYAAIAASLILSTFCWWSIRRSPHRVLLKTFLAVLAAIPFVGPFIYLFAHTPPRSAEKEPAVLRRWNEHEHICLGFASFVFWALAVIAYWMNDWRPGHFIEGRFGTYTTVDVIFFSLLIGTILTFAAAIRAKAVFMDELHKASRLLTQ